MYYNNGTTQASSIVIKVDPTHLQSFDFKDLALLSWDAAPPETIVSLTITGARTAGGPVTATVTNKAMPAGGATQALSGWSVDLSAFTNVTQLTFDLQVSGQIWNIDFCSITIDNQVLAPVPGVTPTIQTRNLEVGSIGSGSASLLWTGGNGSKRILFVKAGNSGQPPVTDGTIYNPNSSFSAAADIGGGWKCLYKGTQPGTIISGLSASTGYRFVVYEMDGSGGGEKYLTTIGSNAINQSSTSNFASWSGGEIKTLNAENFWTWTDGSRDNAGNSYVAHRNSSTTGLTEVEKWNGTSWSTLPNFGPGAGGYSSFNDDISVDVSGDNQVHLALRGRRPDGYVGIIYAYYNGTSWSFSNVDFVTDPSGWKDCRYPVIAVDGAGIPHILYTYTDANAPTTQQIRVASKSGASWTIETLSTITAPNSHNEVHTDYLLLTDADSKMHVFYFLETVADHRSLHHRTNASGSWTDETVIADSTESLAGLKGALDAAGKIHLAFSYGASPGVRYLTNVSGSWASQNLLPFTSGYRPSGLRKNANGDIVIAADNYQVGSSINEFRILVRNPGNPWRLSETSGGVGVYEGYESVTFSDDSKVMLGYANELNQRPRKLFYKLASLALNTAPTLAANAGLTVNQTAGATTITSAMLSVTDAEQGAAALTYTVGTAPIKGTLALSGTALAAGGTFTQADINNNRITYAPSGAQIGADSFTFTVSDGDGGTIGSSTFAISITDNVAPTAAISYSPAGPFTKGTTVIITADFSEAIADAPIMQIAVSAVTGGSVLAATNMSKVSPTRYTYLYTVGNGNGTANVTLSTGQDAAGNPITSTPTSGGSFTVVRTSSTTSLVSSGNPSNLNSDVTFTATVTLGATGTVAFYDGATAISGCGTQPLLGTTATCTVSSLAAGSRSITAAYGGDVTYAPSTSAVLTQVVNTPPTFVGALTTLLVNRDAPATDIKDLLHINDPDSSQTETWTQSTAPDHGGTLAFSGATASSGGADIPPGGNITYQPAAGYSGPEAFTVQVSDGIATATRTITVTVDTPPVFTGTPTIIGGVALGSTLNLADTGTNDVDGDPVTLSYQWKADGGDIGGANASTLVVTSAQLHKTVTCTITADDGRGGTTTFTTAGVYINQSPGFSGVPAVSGDALVGNIISLTATDISDPDGDSVTLSYQWRVDGAGVSGATLATFVPTSDEAGKTVSCVLTGNDGYGGTATATTAGVVIDGSCVGSIPAGLVSLWPGNGNTEDIAGGNHGTTMNGAAFAAGQAGQSFSFDGVASHIRVPDDSSLRLSAFTWAAWFYWDDLGTNSTGFLLGKAVSNFEVQTGGDSGVNGIRFIPAGHPMTTLDAPNFIQPGWNHIAVAYDGSTAYIYSNGSLFASRTGIAGGNDLTADASPLLMGRRGDASFPFHGRIDESILFNRVLTADEIIGLYRAGTPGRCVCTARPAGLVSWWAADSNAQDLVGGNDGTLAGAATFTAGKAGNAFSLSGPDSYVSVPDAPSLRVSEFTVSAWFRWDGMGTSNVNFLFGKAAGNFEIQTGGDSGNDGIRFIPAGAPTAIDASNFIQAGWNHVAVTYNGAEARIYRNGVEVASRTGLAGGADLTADSSPFLIGASAGGDSSFQGRIDEALFFSRALTAPEIAEIFAAGSSSLCTNPVIYNIQPAGLINTTDTIVSASFSVVGSVSTSAVQLDGAPLAGCTTTTSSISCPVTGLSQGDHTIDVTVTDDSARTATGSGAFTVDAIAPTAAISYSPAGPFTKGMTVTITADFSKPMADSPVTQIAISAVTGGTALAATNMTKVSPTRYTYSYLVGNGNGTANVSLAAGEDLAGNLVTAAPTSGGSFTVNPTASSASLAASPNPSTYGRSVTFTATVTAGATGTVDFRDGGVAIAGCSGVALDGTDATCTTNQLPVGIRSITAVYSGDETYHGSTSSALSQTVNKAEATIVTTSSVNPSVYGQVVVLMVSLAPVPPAGSSPTGTVSIVVDGGAPISAPLLAGSATVSLPVLSVGSHSIAASYSGDSNYQAAGPSNLSQNVGKSNTILTLVSNPNPSVPRQTINITLVASPVSPGSGVPSGTVTLSVDGAPQLPVALVAGTATIALPGLSVGNHAMIGTYGSDANFNESSGAIAGGQLVNQGSSAVVVTSAANPTNLGAAATFTATVSAIAPAAGTPTGNVQFIIDGGTPNAVALTGGSASFTTSSLSAGLRQVVVNYLGDSEFLESSGILPAGQQVDTGEVTVSVSTSMSPSRYGQPVTLSATVVPVAPAATAPTGSVTFIIDGTDTATVALSGAIGSLVTGALTVGTHTIQARYEGDSNYSLQLGDLGTPQQVDKSDVTVSVASNRNPCMNGEAVTFTATVTPVAPGAGTPGGTLSFVLDGGTPTSVPVVNGRGTWLSPALTAGAHTLIVRYDGDAGFNPAAGELADGQVVRSDFKSIPLLSPGSLALLGLMIGISGIILLRRREPGM